MQIEILCDGCIDCTAIKGMVCQAVSDLNLNAEVLTSHDPQKHRGRRDCDGLLRMRIDNVVVSARSDCTVRDLMLIFNKEPIAP